MTFFVALACSPPERVEGVLNDALRGVPIVGATVRAEAPEADCLRVSSVTDSGGHFVVEAPCVGSRFFPVDDRWSLATSVGLDGTAMLRLDAWPVPAADGLYRLRGDEFLTLTTNTPMGSLRLAGGEVRYPLVLPGERPDIHDADYVMVAGAGLEAWGAARLCPSPELRVDGPDGPSTFGAWSVVGAEVGLDGGIVPLPQLTGGRDVSIPDARPIRYLSLGDQVPGPWILTESDNRRGVVIDLVDG